MKSKLTKRDALVVLFLILTALFFAPLAASKMPFSVCLFHQFTGWPCPFCGGTRSLVALGGLKFSEAILLNPLVAFTCLAVLIFLPVQIFSEKARQWMRDWPWGKVFLILLPLNWIYLIFKN